MKSPFKRRTAIAALLLAPALTACGFGAQTDQVYQPGFGVNDRSGDVDILNALIVSNGAGGGTFAGSLVNNTSSEITLTNVTGSDVTATPNDAKGIAVPALSLVNLAKRADTGRPVQLAVIGEAVQSGKYVTMTFTFSAGPAITMKVPVIGLEDHEGEDYHNVPLVPTEASQPTEPAKPKKQGEPASQPTDAATTE